MAETFKKSVKEQQQRVNHLLKDWIDKEQLMIN